MAEREMSDLRPEEVEALARFQEELRRMSVGDHVVTMVQSLAALAVRKMGVTPDTAVERDLEQARQAIDAFRALLPVIEGSRPEEEMVAHRKVLADLQMAYVGAMQRKEPEASE